MTATDAPDVVAMYIDALAGFGAAVQDVRDHEWDLPTPCTEWDVRQVVAHVVLGEAALTAAARGDGAGATVDVDASVVGTHPMSTWRGTALAAIDIARSDAMLDTDYDYASGRIPGRQILGYRISENLVHSWDITLAIGRPVEPEETIAEFALGLWLPAIDELRDSGDYAEPVMPDAAASAGRRLLALLGRS